MNKRIESYVNSLFAKTGNDSKVLDFKEELLANLNEKYNDLLMSGKSEDEAFELVVAGIGNIEKLLEEISGKGSNLRDRSDTLLKSEGILLKAAKNIVIECTSETLEIHKVSGDSINIRQYGNPNTRSEDLFLFSTSDDTVHIYIKKTYNFTFNILNFYREKIIVEIPESFKGNLSATASSGSVKIEDELILKSLHLHNSSGGINLKKSISTDLLNINSSSGKIKLDDLIQSKEVYMKTTSGGIYSAMNINSDEKISLESSSGKIHLDKYISTKLLNAGTSSGGIRLIDADVEKFDLQSSSGAIRVDSISGEGKTKTSSGSIQITLEPSLEFTLVAQTNSGSIRTNFPVTKNKKGDYVTANFGESPTANITANTSSGSIRIENWNL